MTRAAVHGLLIEDNPGDAGLGKKSRAQWVRTLLPGLDGLSKSGIDAAVLDLPLPDSHGLDGRNAVRIHSPDPSRKPFSFLAGVFRNAIA